MIKATESVTGTVKELIDQGITVNGFELDAASLGCLIHMGMADLVGVAEKPAGKKGRAPKIYRIALVQEVVFSTAPMVLSESAETQEETVVS